MDEAGSGRAKPSVLERRIGEETIVYDRAVHRAHCLGPVSSAVWRSWEPGASVSEIVGRVEAEIREPVGAPAVELTLRRLARAGLVDRPPRRQPGEERRSRDSAAAGRREALRRVAALAGLAVVSLAVPAPEAVAATCTLQVGQACTSTSQCCPTSNGTATCCGQALHRCLPASIANCGP